MDDFSDYEPLTMTDIEKVAMRELNELSKKTGKEYACAIIEGRKSDPFSDNYNDKVRIPAEYLQKEGVKLYHSHTNTTPPSRDDLKFLTNPCVEEIGVITIEGDIYTISRGNGELISDEEFMKETEIIAYQADFELIGHAEFYDWTVTQRNYMGIREQFYQICRRFGWTMRGGRI